MRNIIKRKSYNPGEYYMILFHNNKLFQSNFSYNKYICYKLVFNTYEIENLSHQFIKLSYIYINNIPRTIYLHVT